MGLFSNKNKRKSLGRADAVDTFRMVSTIEDIAKATVRENPSATMAYVLNNIHYEVGRGKYDVQAERELMTQFSGSERDAWYQRIIAPMNLSRGQLMDDARKDSIQAWNSGATGMGGEKITTDFDKKLSNGMRVIVQSDSSTNYYYVLNPDGSTEVDGFTPKQDSDTLGRRIALQYDLVGYDSARADARKDSIQAWNSGATGQGGETIVTDFDKKLSNGMRVIVQSDSSANYYYVLNPDGSTEVDGFTPKQDSDTLGRRIALQYDLVGYDSARSDASTVTLGGVFYEKVNGKWYEIGDKDKFFSDEKGKEVTSTPLLQELMNYDSKQTQGKTMNTLKQDGKQYLLKTDAYEKRFDSEPQAMLFAKRHNIDLSERADGISNSQNLETGKLSPDTGKWIAIHDVSGQGLKVVVTDGKGGAVVEKSKTFGNLNSAKEALEKYRNSGRFDAEEKPADKKEDDEPELDADGNPIEKEKKEEKPAPKEENKDAKVNLDSKMPTFKAIRADESYNGHKNYESWNVSLWIANDYGIYQTAVEYAKSASNPTYRDFIGYAGLSGSTPDGVSWTDPDLDYNSLNQEFQEYRNDSADRTDEERKDEYNGWANRATWNVALWIGNDYGLYQMAQEYMAEANNGTYKDFVAYAGLSGATPDGISWTDGDLNYSELNNMMREL